MHIPDGYLSPASSAVMYAAATPFWYFAVKRVKRVLTLRSVPVVAIFSAFVFVLMMFNIPLPGGTTGHAVGGTLMAIVLGPWTAVLGVSVVLFIQALLFGDGGLLTLGANCVNAAVICPMAGYLVYRMVSVRSSPWSARRLAGAIVGSYVGLVATALATGVELGLQPALFHAADGTPLYAPYPLSIAVPAMAIGHLVVAGPAEAIVTGLVFYFLQRSRSELIAGGNQREATSAPWLAWGAVLLVLALLTPLGLLASGTAWAEWGADEMRTVLGYVPSGLAQLGEFWKTPLADYGFMGMTTPWTYIVTALTGVAVVMLLVWVLGWAMSRSKVKSKEITVERASGGLKRDGFVVRNLSSLTRILESALVTEDLCHLKGVLQGIDPRAKSVAILLLIIAAGMAQDFAGLLVIFAIVVALVLLSKLPAGLFFTRVFVFVPIFTAVIALPALFLTPGAPLVAIGGATVISQQGAHTAGLLLLRVIDSLALGLLLVFTTPWAKLMAALRRFRVPGVVVSTVSMTYCYLVLLLHMASAVFLARRSRTIRRFSSAESRQWMGRVLVATIIRSQHLSEQVYLAMLARGYTGEVQVMDDMKMRRRDLWFPALGVAAVLTQVWLIWRPI